MPLRHLLYRCPLCGLVGTEGEGDRAGCPGCGGRFRRGRGAEVELRPAVGAARSLHPARVLELLESLGGVETDPPGQRVEAAAVRHSHRGARPVRSGGAVVGWSERATSARPGRLWIDGTHLGFDGDDGARSVWSLVQVRSVQLASKTLQVCPNRYSDTMSFELLTASPLRWEELLRRRIASTRTRTRVLEYQPRIVTADDAREARNRAPSPRGVPRRVGSEGPSPRAWLYPVVRLALRLLAPLRVRLAVEGVENVPGDGACVLVVNHQSLIDAPLVQSACPRQVRAMTKSTQFRSPAWSRLLTGLGAFPVRRFEPDPQAVRTALRILARGEVLAIYPEGERSWDGRLQPFRRGTVRLLLAVGAPVVPVGVTGAYDVWPRWSRRLRRGRVRIRFGAPLRFPVLARRPEREAALPRTAQRLRHAFAELGVELGPHAVETAGESEGGQGR